MTNNKTKKFENFKHATAATLRAVADDKNLEVMFAAGRPALMRGKVRIRPPRRAMTEDDRILCRSESDMLALRSALHDAKIHQQMRPLNISAQASFDSLEKLRCNIEGSRGYKGIISNIAAGLEEDAHNKGYDKATARENVPLSDALPLFLFSEMTGHKFKTSARAALKQWEPWFQAKLHGLDYKKLGEAMADQKVYAKAVHKLLDDIDIKIEGDFDLPDDGETESEEQESKESGDMQQRGDEDGTEDTGSEISGDDDMAAAAGEGIDDEENEEEQSPADGENKAGRAWDEIPHDTAAGIAENYHIYTNKHDKEIAAYDLCDEAELSRLRITLDQRMSHIQGAISRLANRLQRRLMAQQQRNWHFDQEEGILDAARLARIVANPLTPLSYKYESELPFKDTIVSLLIDNSGSMRGRPISTAAICSDILAKTLERCGVATEILGFTTINWKGGESHKDWLKAGKPKNPGRLNDLHHIIYKRADEPMRRAKHNLGLMLREGILKENIDGEALLWAHKRLIARPEERRILLIISDGSPNDDKTISHNPAGFLDKHLKDVISNIEKTSPIELLAIGIGHDVTRYYQKAIKITGAEQLGTTLIEKLAELFEANLEM